MMSIMTTPETPAEAPTTRNAAPRFNLLRIRGAGAATFLQRMLSNSVADLPEHEARGAFLLEDTGRIRAGAVFLRDGDDFLAICPGPEWRDRLQEGLEHYRIADPVEFIPDPTPVALIVGQGDDVPGAIWEIRRDPGGVSIRWPWTGLDERVRIGEPASIADMDPGAVERERIRAGTPRFDVELTPRTIPVEALLFDWLDARKGCYVGQEVVERMWSRQRAARQLCGFVCDSPPPEAEPAPLAGEGGLKAELTSIAADAGGAIALGWLRGAPPTDGLRLQDASGAIWETRLLPMAGDRQVPQRRFDAEAP